MKYSYEPRDTLKLGPSINIIKLELNLLLHTRNNEYNLPLTKELKIQFHELENTHTHLLTVTLKQFQDLEGLPYKWRINSITQEITDLTGILTNINGWSFYMGWNTQDRKEFKQRITQYKKYLQRLTVLLDRLKTKSAPLLFQERMKPRGIYTLNMNNILAYTEGSERDTEPATIKPEVLCVNSGTNTI